MVTFNVIKERGKSGFFYSKNNESKNDVFYYNKDHIFWF